MSRYFANGLFWLINIIFLLSPNLIFWKSWGHDPKNKYHLYCMLPSVVLSGLRASASIAPWWSLRETVLTRLGYRQRETSPLPSPSATSRRSPHHRTAFTYNTKQIALDYKEQWVTQKTGRESRGHFELLLELLTTSLHWRLVRCKERLVLNYLWSYVQSLNDFILINLLPSVVVWGPVVPLRSERPTPWGSRPLIPRRGHPASTGTSPKPVIHNEKKLEGVAPEMNLRQGYLPSTGISLQHVTLKVK